MKAVFLFLGAAFCTLQTMSQDVPLIKVGETDLGVSKLYVDVAVVGNRMTTTYDMYFYNPQNEILEGELNFPLGEGQSVSRFALDVNGVLRESVAVEKEQGRVAFEAVVRRKVDPALLEKGTGNNYKARIYPIPRKGYKRVVLAYEEPLKISEGNQMVKVPLSFRRKLEDFSLDVSIAGSKAAPKIVSKARIKSNFRKTGENYELDFSAKQFKPAQDFEVKLELQESIAIVSSGEYTYAYRPISNPMIARKKLQSVQLLWDVSYSMQERDLEKEFAFMDAYFKEAGDLNVEIVAFSDAIISQQNFTITKGNWSQIRELLESSVYDGATSYNNLITTSDRHDAILLFSDGMNTLSDFPVASQQPLFLVNSIRKANHAANKDLAETTRGAYINLNDLSIKEALFKMQYLPLQFLGVNSRNKNAEVYPKSGTTVFNDFSMAARGFQAGETVELLFGYGDVITLKEKFTVPSSDDAISIERIWAQMKVAQLEKKGDNEKNAIIEVAKEFNLVTSYTSLIVLETMEDYKRFAITPPKDMFKRNSERVAEETDRAETKKRSESSVTRATGTTLPVGAPAAVSGTVVDPDGFPIPGVNVFVANTSNGTQTDFDGKYSIEAPAGSDLVFSYVGYATLETTVRGSGAINLTMEGDVESLEEVVVTGYNGAQRRARATGYAVTILGSGDLNDKPEPDAIRSITGKVAGAQITGSSGATGSGTNFVIRSKSSINGNNQPLFIVDGIPFNSGTNAQGGLGAGGTVTSSRFLDLDPNMIEKVQVLKGLSAAVLYGQEGRNGVVIITTKNDPSSTDTTATFGSKLAAEREAQAEKRRTLMREKTLKEMGFTTPYLEELQNAIGEKDMYLLYLNQREAYSDYPSYFVDVYDFFRNANAKFADRILSNIIEMDTDNYELLRVYAYKLEEKGDFETAAYIYRQVLKLRSEDAQSYRDLALALAEIGKQDEALSLLTKVMDDDFYEGSHRRDFDEIKPIILNEIKNLILSKGITTLPEGLPKSIYKGVELDMRIVIDWNHNDTDIDLHIVDPNLEKCFYGNQKTKMGGRLSDDMTEGFGPEEFVLEEAGSGSYYVKIDYFGDNYQKIENPTFMKVSIFENYGTPSQQRRIKVMRLTEDGDERLVERIALL